MGGTMPKGHKNEDLCIKLEVRLKDVNPKDMEQTTYVKVIIF